MVSTNAAFDDVKLGYTFDASHPLNGAVPKRSNCGECDACLHPKKKKPCTRLAAGPITNPSPPVLSVPSGVDSFWS